MSHPTLRPRHAAPARLLALALPVALVLGAAACSRGETGDTGGSVAARSGLRPREAPLVRVEPVERREMVQVLDTTTVVESDREIQVFARAPGVVVELLAEEGDRVAAGAALARLDARDREMAVQDAEVALREARNLAERLEIAAQEAEQVRVDAERAAEQAQRDFERDARLAPGGESTYAALSAKELEASRLARDNARSTLEQAELALRRARIEAGGAETGVARAQVALDRARLELSFTEISAPFEGVVAARNIRVGDTVGAGAAAFVLTDPDRLRAVFWRPQRELGLFLGQGGGGPTNGGGHGAGTAPEPLEITARAEALAGWTFTGRIERTSPTIDPESGSFRVTARLDPPAEAESDARLLPGMLVRLEVVTERHPDALVVPKRALRREGEQVFLFRVEDGVARRVEVEEGFGEDEAVEVLPVGDARLEEGDAIVVVGNRDLEDGSPVKVDEPAAAEPEAAEPEAEPAPGPDGEPEPAAETGSGLEAQTGTDSGSGADPGSDTGSGS